MSIRHFGQSDYRPAWSLCTMFLLTVAITGHAHAAICRVTTVGNSTNDGSSWSVPLDMQVALGDSACAEIWVAQGVYVPVMPADPNNVTEAERAISFMIQPGITVYGGFDGTEKSLNERDPNLNATILSGDIDANDVNDDGNSIDETWTDIVGSNSYHVLYLDGTTGTPITSSTVLDGFTITGGEASGTNLYQDTGGGLYCDGHGADHECSPAISNAVFSGNSAAAGGAMYNSGRNKGTSNPTFADVDFSNNFASKGGAVYNNGDFGTSSPSFSNVVFSGNEAVYSGGAIVNWGDFGTSSPVFIDVTFRENSADSGGAMHSIGTFGSSTPMLTNVTFAHNHATNSGGAMANIRNSPNLSNVTFHANDCGGLGGAIYNNRSSPVLSNVTFHGNSAGFKGGAMHNYGAGGAVLSNVILWGNSAAFGSPEIYNANGATPLIDHSVIQGSGGSSSWDSSLGTDAGGNLDADPLLGPLGDYGGPTATIMLGRGSSAINAGDPAVCISPPVNGLDQRGVWRFEGENTLCDIGAVEMRLIIDHIFANGFESVGL